MALKKVKVRKPEDGLPKELVREIESVNALKRKFKGDLNSKNIVDIKEVYLGKTSLNIVYTPFCPQLDLQHMMARRMPVLQAFAISYQLMKAIEAVHDAKLMHRDIKPANVVISGSKIYLCDFGQCRVDMTKLLTEIEQEKQEDVQKEEIDNAGKKYAKLTLEVGSRWYKSPELLFGNRTYTQKLDMWQVGCVIAELAIACLPDVRCADRSATLNGGDS